MRFLIHLNKISAHPPVKKSIEEFISEANEKKRDQPKSYQKAESYPWEGKLVRADIQKVFTVKLQEEYILKIKYISEKTNKSQQKIVREIICEEIDKIIMESKY